MTAFVFFSIFIIFIVSYDLLGTLYLGLALWEHFYASHNDGLYGVAYYVKVFKDNFSDFFENIYLILLLGGIICFCMLINSISN